MDFNKINGIKNHKKKRKRVKLGIRGVIQEAKRLHKIEASLDLNRNVAVFLYKVNQSAYPLNLAIEG